MDGCTWGSQFKTLFECICNKSVIMGSICTSFLIMYYVFFSFTMDTKHLKIWLVYKIKIVGNTAMPHTILHNCILNISVQTRKLYSMRSIIHRTFRWRISKRIKNLNLKNDYHWYHLSNSAFFLSANSLYISFAYQFCCIKCSDKIISKTF